MKNGKHAAAGGMKRSLVLVVSVLALVLAVAGGTLAWLTANSGPVTNTFTPAKVTCEVDETFKNNVKSAVSIRNTSNIDAYIRAYVVVTWKNADGEVYGKLPVEGEGKDYTMTMPKDTKWFTSGDYYYYPEAVPSGESTGVLIEKCELTGNPPADGYSLSVEIIAEAIQSQPDDAVRQAWGVVPSTLANQSGN